MQYVLQMACLVRVPTENVKQNMQMGNFSKAGAHWIDGALSLLTHALAAFAITVTLTRGATHAGNHSLDHSLHYSLTGSLTHSLHYSLTGSLTHSLHYSLTGSLTHSLHYSLTGSLTHSLHYSGQAGALRATVTGLVEQRGVAGMWRGYSTTVMREVRHHCTHQLALARAFV